MAASDPIATPQRTHIEQLIRQLEQGGAVAVDVALRLHQVLERLEPLAEERIAAVVVAVAVKGEGDRERVRAVANRWARGLPRVERAGLPYDGPEEAAGDHWQPQPTPTEPVESKRPGRAIAILGSMALIVGALLILWSIAGEPVSVSQRDAAVDAVPTPDGGTDAIVDVGGDGAEASAPVPRLEPDEGDAALPDPEIVAGPFVDSQAELYEPTWPWGLIGLLLGALGALGLLGWLLVRRPRYIEALTATEGPPPGEIPRSPREAAHVIEPVAEELLVWGIDRYVSTEESRQLDIPATVRVTAATGGLPSLIRCRARHPREVWLWVDRDAARRHPVLDRAAQAVAEALRRASLPVEIAYFHGVPIDLIDEHGDVVTPVELDERRGAARIAILTDGEVLAARMTHLHAARGIDGDLRLISRWPAVCVFEFGDGTHRLDEVLAPYEIEVRRADDLVEWLGGVAVRAASSGANDTTVWAAACALAPTGVDFDTALALRAHLELEVTPWQVRQLTAEAGGGRGRLVWPSPRRESLISWLFEVVPAKAAVVRDFWITHYRRAATVAERSASAAPSDQSPHWHAMKACAALLDLWRGEREQVEVAVADLFRYRKSSERLIRRQLERWAPADGLLEGRAKLPWRFGELEPPTREMLRTLGLGGLETQRRERVQRPGRVWAAFGAVGAVALVAAILVAGTQSGQARSAYSKSLFRVPGCLTSGTTTWVGFRFTTIYRCIPSTSNGVALLGRPRQVDPFWISESLILPLEWLRMEYRVTVNYAEWIHVGSDGEYRNRVRAFCNSEGARLPSQRELIAAQRHLGKETLKCPASFSEAGRCSGEANLSAYCVLDIR